MTKIEFQTPALQARYDARIAELQQLASNPHVTRQALWDSTVTKCATTMRQVQQLFKAEELKELVTEKIKRQMNSFWNKCNSPDFHIALVGTIKAGKSTLINALLDKQLASTEVTPETASLTKFRGSSSGNYVSVTFYSPAEWDKLWASANDPRNNADIFLEEFHALNAQEVRSQWVGQPPQLTRCTLDEMPDEIKKWTSSQSPVHFFVKEVEVGLQDFLISDAGWKIQEATSDFAYKIGESRSYNASSATVAETINVAAILSDYNTSLSQKTAELETKSKECVSDYFTKLLDVCEENKIFGDNHRILDRLKRQKQTILDSIPNAFNHVLAVRISISDSECKQILNMPSGADKERRMKEFGQNVIREGIDKLCQTVKEATSSLQNELIDEMDDFLQTQKSNADAMQHQLEEILNRGSANVQAKEETKFVPACKLVALEITSKVLETGDAS